MSEIFDFKQLENQYFIGKNIVMVIGFFDGIHRGHQRIISLCKERAQQINGKSLVFTFDKPPLNIIKGKIQKKLIMPYQEKVKLIEDLGVDYIITKKFDREFSKITPHQFCKNILLQKFHLKEIFIGEGFRFGYKGIGDENFLKEFFKGYGVNVNIIPLLKKDNLIVSSTSIRRFYKQGNIDKIKLLLGRQPFLTGKVVKGSGRGKKLAFPTANIDVSERYITPKDGVYIGEARIGNNNSNLPCLINIGDNPTFGGKKKWVEAYIINFNKNIYNVKIYLYFIKKLRDEIEFSGKEELIRQIKEDIMEAKLYFNLIIN
ncbi:MAG: bifunctional riboflavin kinase/FAD synthetase [Actinomycetota bacterium]